jgi:CubicO group peptidase (beta-lactamase class C family)
VRERAPQGSNGRRSAVAATRALLTGAATQRTFPAAVAEVGDGRGVIWREAFGTLTFDTGSAEADERTIFDLASLTKPLATTSAAMQLVASRSLALDEPLGSVFEEWRGADRELVTVRDLLEHASGLAARLVDQPPDGRREFEHEICTMPLEYQPREKSVYSDLGFILLGFLVEARGGRPLSAQFGAIVDRVAEMARAEGDVLGFVLPEGGDARSAPTWPMDDDRRRGRLLRGEVHDNYAAALGGAAGHAGLFGTAGGVGAFARCVLRSARGDESVPTPLSPRMVSQMTRKSDVPGSSRGLGWDTMLPTSSCGAMLSPAAFGHAGFTGTSLWIDPVLDRYFVLLTNRVCCGGSPEAMREVRRAFHDAAARI